MIVFVVMTTYWRFVVSENYRRLTISRPLPSTKLTRPWIRRVVALDDIKKVNKVYLDFMIEVERIVNGNRPLILCCPTDVLDDIGYLLYHDLTMAVLGQTDDFPVMATEKLLSTHRRLLRIVMRADADAVKRAAE